MTSCRRRWASPLAQCVLLLAAAAPGGADEPGGADSAEMDEILGLADEAPGGAAPGAGELGSEPFDPELESERARKTEGIEEIIVEGARQKQSLQDVPISITEFSASDIENLRIQDVSDLAAYTPNLEINTSFAASNATLFIRGIGLKDYNANAAGAVAVYQDGIYLNSPAANLFQLFDVESVEVLRGPQGALYSRNATAGAVVVTSRQPDGSLDARGSASYGNYNLVEVRGAVGFPILGEALSARLAVAGNYRDPWRENGCAGLPPRDPQPALNPSPPPIVVNDTPDLPCQLWNPLDGRDWPTDFRFEGLRDEVNNTKNWASRGMLRLQPSDAWDWLLNLHGGQNRSHARHHQMCGTTGKQGSRQERLQTKLNCTGFNVAGFSEAEIPGVGELEGFPQDPDVGWYDQTGREKLDTWGLGLTGSWQLGTLPALGSTRLLSIAGYEWNSRFVEDEGDACPCVLLPARWKDGAWQLSHELRAEGAGDSYTWKLGSYLLYEELDAHNQTLVQDAGGWDSRIQQTVWNVAPYATASFQLSDKWSLRGGLRYNWEYKEFSLVTALFESHPESGEILGTPREVRPKESVNDIWSGITGEFTVSYSPVEQITGYVKYARAMKSGHFNASATVMAQSIKPVKPEFNDSVELGLKGSLLGGRLEFGGAVFRYWYRDLQVYDTVNEAGEFPLPQLLNSPGANVLGADLELRANPLPNLTAVLNFGWLDSEFEDFSVMRRVRRGGFGRPPLLSRFEYSGNPLLSAPEFSFSGFADYEIPLPREWGSLVPRFDWSYRSETVLALVDFDSSTFSFPQPINALVADGFWLFGVQLAYRSPDRKLEVIGWVENLTDERYLVDAFDLTTDIEAVRQVWNDPRSYGVTLRYQY